MEDRKRHRAAHHAMADIGIDMIHTIREFSVSSASAAIHLGFGGFCDFASRFRDFHFSFCYWCCCCCCYNKRRGGILKTISIRFKIQTHSVLDRLTLFVASYKSSTLIETENLTWSCSTSANTRRIAYTQIFQFTKPTELFWQYDNV